MLVVPFTACQLEEEDSDGDYSDYNNVRSSHNPHSSDQDHRGWMRGERELNPTIAVRNVYFHIFDLSRWMCLDPVGTSPVDERRNIRIYHKHNLDYGIYVQYFINLSLSHSNHPPIRVRSFVLIFMCHTRGAFKRFSSSLPLLNIFECANGRTVWFCNYSYNGSD